jgi:hypothetical protein
MKRFILTLFAAMLVAAAAVPAALASEGPGPVGCSHIKTHAAEYVPDFLC